MFRIVSRLILLKPIVPRFEFGSLAKLFKPTRIPGQARTKNSHTSKTSWKKRGKTPIRNYKISNHKGLLKRIKIVGPRRDRRVKFKAPGARHLNRNKSKANLRYFIMKIIIDVND